MNSCNPLARDSKRVSIYLVNKHILLVYFLYSNFVYRSPKMYVFLWDSWRSPVVHLIRGQFIGWYIGLTGFLIIILMIGKRPH